MALLGRTTSIKERSDIYGELFSKRGREKLFCAHLNERREDLRIKFKIAEINPEIALKNLQELQGFINAFPGDSASDKVACYRDKTKKAMTSQLVNLLQIPPERCPPIFWRTANAEQEICESSKTGPKLS